MDDWIFSPRVFGEPDVGLFEWFSRLSEEQHCWLMERMTVFGQVDIPEGVSGLCMQLAGPNVALLVAEDDDAMEEMESLWMPLVEEAKSEELAVR